MKKCYKSFILLAFVALCATASSAQEPLVVEYESSPPPNSIIAILIGLFTPDDFDFNGDGKRDIISRVGNNLLVLTFSQPDNMLFNGTAAGISLDDYRCLGFHDIGGGAEKELVLVPKSFTFHDVIISSYSFSNNQFVPSFSWGASMGGWQFGVDNTDGDPQSEILALLPNQEFYVLGQGFTPGLKGDNPTEKLKGEKPSNKSLGLLNFEIQMIAPPNFRWPGNYTYVEPGSQDLNSDNIDDYGYLNWAGAGAQASVISGASQNTIYSSPLSDQFSFNFTTMAYFDVTGEGYKHIMIGGSNSGSSLTDMEIILWLNPQTNEVNTSLMPFLEQGFRVVSIGNPFGMGGTPTTGIIMRHMTTGRVIVVGDGPGLQNGPSGSLTSPSLPDGGNLAAYLLNMVYESQVPMTLFMPSKGQYGGSELDVNGDGTMDIPCLVLQDSVGSDVAGFTVLDGEGFEPIWETTVPIGGTIDPAPFFHGFFDANGDGQKEIIFGAETVQTHDSQIHKPFGAGFQIKFIYDLDGDGFEEVIGSTPEGKVQVWSSHAFVSSDFEQQAHAFLELNFFPNPNNGKVNLELSQPTNGAVSLRIFDAKGSLVQNIDMGHLKGGETLLQFELSSKLPNGQYFINTCSSVGCTVEKIILER